MQRRRMVLMGLALVAVAGIGIQFVPVSWRVVADVERARRVLNFSDWATHTEANQRALRTMVHNATASHRMPAWYYVSLHPDAKLTDHDLDALRRWADTTSVRP